MRAETISGGRHWMLVFNYGDRPLDLLARFAREENVVSGQFSAIGGFSEVVLGYFSWETKDYEEIPIQEQVEILSLQGDISWVNSEPRIHAHVIVGKHDGSAHGGHLLRGVVRPTLELSLIEGMRPLYRRVDASSGLPLIDPLPSH